jgi:hypothetical protein
MMRGNPKLTAMWSLCAAMAILASSSGQPVTAADQGERCFGALGMECGPQSNLMPTALCALGYCKINGGSWEHDECCWANKGSGKLCIPTASSPGAAQVCNASWQKALSRITGGWNWTRQVDFNRRNASGKVERSRYCATKDARVHKGDVEYCCSGQATNPSNDHPDARICK